MAGKAGRQETLPREALAQVADRFKLLSNPTRLEILQHICDGEMTVGELVGRTGFKQANVSKQLGLLDRGGLVRRRAEGTRVYYTVADPMLPQLCRVVKETIRTTEDGRLRALGR